MLRHTTERNDRSVWNNYRDGSAMMSIIRHLRTHSTAANTSDTVTVTSLLVHRKISEHFQKQNYTK